jgi:predicted ATPase/signal transduction histidine kinase
MDVIPGYIIVQELQQGTRTLIYQARRISDMQPVILKVPRGNAPLPEELARLRHEYEIICTLDSPGVIQPHGLERNGHSLALMLEDFGGSSLRQMIAAGPLRVTDFLPLAIRLATTLGEVHQHNIMHRDLKPSNILFNPATQQIKIADFGSASRFTRDNLLLDNPQEIEGTLDYMAPEQTGRLNRRLDYRADFYALGVTFYELLSGQLPFQGSDPLELVHAHIARQPPPLTERNPQVPAPLAAIVARLMAKAAEDRYQSAHGLRADLEHCLTEWQQHGSIAPFALGQHDLPDRLVLPQTLYGREPQRETLRAAFARIQDGAAEVLLISGPAGSGKSALINDLRQPVMQARGLFLVGKCNQAQRMVPYSPLIQAFQELVRQLAAASEAQLAAWRERLLAALGDSGQLVTALIPEIEWIIGPQPPAATIPPVEGQTRFHRVVQRLIQACSAAEHPLVLVLDDLQWADGATLALLRALVTEHTFHHLLLIGAYRDHEVGTGHPLAATLQQIGQAGACVQHTALPPLDSAQINHLLADTLHQPPAATLPLAELLLSKTGGNPFFLTQMLAAWHQNHMLTFDYASRQWRWSLPAMQDVGLPDDVATFVADKIQQLERTTQHVLQLAACIGSQFDAAMLAHLAEQPPAEVSRHLQPAIQEGLLRRSGWSTTPDVPDDALRPAPRYAFVHHRVQQAAYALLSEADRKVAHLHIARRLLQNRSPDETDERLFDIATHLAQSRDLITEPSAREQAARLHLSAGRKARASAAYETAYTCFRNGIDMLAPSAWQSRYQLALDLHTAALEAAFLTTRFEQLEPLAAPILTHAHAPLDKVKVYEIRIRHHTAQSEMLAAVEIALQVLDMLGVPLSSAPPDPDGTALHTAAGIAELPNRPPMTNPEHQEALRICVLLLPTIYQVRPDLIAPIAYTMVRLCLASGNSPYSALAYAFYGMLLCARGDIDNGYHLGHTALRMMQQYNAPELTAKRVSLFEFIRHWKEHLRASIPHFHAGIQGALDVGDIERAGYHAVHYCRYMFVTGEPLPAIEQQQLHYLDLLHTLKQDVAHTGLLIDRQLVAALRAEPESEGSPPWHLAGASFDAAQMLPRYEEANNSGVLFSAFFAQLYLAYLFGQYAPAVASARRAEAHLHVTGGRTYYLIHACYAALALLAYVPQAPPEEHDALWAEIATNRERLARGAAHAPMNYRHRCDLVDAEYARVRGDIRAAMDGYDRAIEGARDNAYPHEAALANELAARFYLGLGRERFACLYLEEACAGYRAWGAVALVRRLEQQELALREQPAAPAESTSHTSTSSTGSTLDLNTVMKAAQTLSSEIVLDTLLEKMMCIVLESAGAQRGFILLETEDQLVIEAAGSVSSEPDTTVLKSVPLAECTDLSQAVVNYVRRTGESLVIADATQDSRLIHDPYVVQQRPRSMLCIPVSSRGGLAGVLYLENNLVVGAFTPDRIEMIQMLVAHAAISLENARLYDEMKNEINERKRAEEALRSITEGTASVTGGDFFRSLVRYLAAAFEVRYAFVAECIDTSLTQVRTLALLGEGQFQENIEYDVRGTPCDKVIGGQVCYYPERLYELFPSGARHESYLGAPLHDSAGTILGHLAIIDDEPMHRQPYDISIMRIFAARAGAELERKRTEEALRQSEEELRELNEQLADYTRNLERKVAERTHEIEQRRQVAERLRDMLAILNSNRSLDEILDYVVEQATSLLGTRSSAIYRLQREERVFTIQAARGLPTEYTDDLSFPLDRSFLGRAVLNRRPMVIHDLETALHSYDIELSADRRVLLTTYHSLLAVPLIRQGESEEENEIYGGIALYYSEPHQVSEEEIGLAVAFADQAALAIENARLRQRVEQAAVMEERSRLARELHDSVTQSLYSLTLLAEGWRRLAASGRMDDLADPLAELGGIAQQALKEMRLLVHELRPPALERDGLLGALHERLAAVERRAGVDARLLADDVVDLPAQVEEGLYRIAQEALNNALKHAAATTVSVHLQANAQHVELIISDNGCGFDPAHLTDQGGIGLSSMRERAERLGGTLVLTSAPEQGTRVYVWLAPEHGPRSGRH